MNTWDIPLAKPNLGKAEEKALSDVIKSQQLVLGPRVAEFEAQTAQLLSHQFATATSSGTSALYLALRALEIGPGDEVIVPNLTWPSPAYAVLECGAEAVLVDVDAEEWNLTAAMVKGALTPKTKAVIAIDQFGFPARVQEIRNVCGDIPIIEDAACAIGSTLEDSACGSKADIACLSFHPRKLLTTGEGGMCLTSHESLFQKIKALSNHGQIKPGQFVVSSINHRMSELQAALGIEQLKKLPDTLKTRRTLADHYRAALPIVQWQKAPERAECNYQTMGFTLAGNWNTSRRDALIETLRKQRIQAGILSYALNNLPPLAHAASESKARGLALTQSEAIASQGIAVPMYDELLEEQIDRIANVITSFLNSSS